MRELLWSLLCVSPDLSYAIRSPITRITNVFYFPVLRSTIGSHVDYLDEPLHVNQELKMYACVSELVRGYHCLSRLIDTPFPFPLAQMNRTFVVIWVFTLPMALFHDNDDKLSSIIATFFLTYGAFSLFCWCCVLRVCHAGSKIFCCSNFLLWIFNLLCAIILIIF